MVGVPTDATSLLEARDLTAVLSGDAGDVRVLDGVSLTLSAGEIVDIVGPSGAGKSTLVRALARLLPSAKGRLVLEGTPAEDISPHDWRARVTLLPQKAAIVEGTVRDNLELPWRFKVRSSGVRPSADDLRASLDALSLEDVALDRDAARLSVGQQTRLAFARVWLSCPRVLLLDEADAALDDDSAAKLSAAVVRFAAGEGGSRVAGGPPGVIRVRHRADDGLASRRFRMQDGRLEQVSR